ncbi:MAG: nucleotidyl transferase AbiEii/AbiGii toxin family protein [Ignavibacteriae bacterium]|nr:nucleotidyl transferase AbiEii/AbiGii toxin family protein [Ignavibacteriota bacterium]
MINKESFSKEHIENLRNIEGKKTNPEFIERMIRAFALVDALKQEGLDFTFKGGTSIVLLKDKVKRFSIDVDIVINETESNLEQILENIKSNYGFLGYEKLEREPNFYIPKIHYKFLYKSDLRNINLPLLLDVLIEDTSYTETCSTDLRCKWLLTEEPYVKITMPTVNSLLGDKLTAFAPNTTGILYKSGKQLQIIKQLFDIGELYELSDNFSAVKDNFKNIVTKEISYRKKYFTEEDVLNDIINTSRFICEGAFQTKLHKNENYMELLDGIAKIDSHLIDGSYRLYEAAESSSKAALLAAKILTGSDDPTPKYNNEDISKIQISKTGFRNLNKLGKIANNKSLFYWDKISKLI